MNVEVHIRDLHADIDRDRKERVRSTGINILFLQNCRVMLEIKIQKASNDGLLP